MASHLYDSWPTWFYISATYQPYSRTTTHWFINNPDHFKRSLDEASLHVVERVGEHVEPLPIPVDDSLQFHHVPHTSLPVLRRVGQRNLDVLQGVLQLVVE